MARRTPSLRPPGLMLHDRIIGALELCCRLGEPRSSDRDRDGPRDGPAGIADKPVAKGRPLPLLPEHSNVKSTARRLQAVSGPRVSVTTGFQPGRSRPRAMWTGQGSGVCQRVTK